MLAMYISKNDSMPQEADKPHERNTAWGMRAKGAAVSDARHLGEANEITFGTRLSDDGIDLTLMTEACTQTTRPNAYEVARTIAAENGVLTSKDLPDVRRGLKEPSSLEYVRAMAECREICTQSNMSAVVVKNIARHPGYDVSAAPRLILRIERMHGYFAYNTRVVVVATRVSRIVDDMTKCRLSTSRTSIHM